MQEVKDLKDQEQQGKQKVGKLLSPYLNKGYWELLWFVKFPTYYGMVTFTVLNESGRILE